MVIEDEQVVLDAVNRIFKAEKLTVDTSLESGTAIEKVQKNDYRLIVCDLMLTGTDGFEFIEKLQDLKIDIPVIMTSGYSTSENAVKALTSGAIDFIPKPFTAEEVWSAISRGFKYREIRESERQRVPGSVAYVPCPPRYFRLGYMTWVSLDSQGSAIIGATDLFLKTIESVKWIEMLSAQDELIQGIPGASIFSLKEERHPLLAPLSGKILQHNHELIKKSTLLEKDPYFRGWIYRIIPSDYQYEIKQLTSCQMALL
jgi:two-component system response regulator FlrC